MILGLDVGNTNIKIGVYDGKKMLHSWRLATDFSKTADEYGIALIQLLESEGIAPKDIEGSIMSSVIPQLNYTVSHMLDYYFNATPIMVGPGVKTGLNIKYENPREVGSDRIVNSVSAFKKYGGPVIVVDFGTATTFNAINGKGEFLGGCICAGVKTSTDALTTAAAKLPRIELVRPPSVIGKTTISNMQAGIVYGLVGQVKHILQLMKYEMNEDNIKVVATGGLSELVQEDKDLIDIFDRRLSLNGLKIIYDLNNG
jgi:type III pantothenate kinase